jgi:hypothetical protein
MKTLLNVQSDKDYLITHSDISHLKTTSSTKADPEQYKKHIDYSVSIPSFPAEDHENLINPKALYQMSSRQLPDLWEVCHQLYHTFFENNASFNALQFIPVLKNMLSIDPVDIERFKQNPETNHVLVQNELLKVVLIHWKPGKYSDIHGHPAGGCVFKVLHGRIEEKRYTPDTKAKLLAVSTYERGSMGYIDDHMAYHAVGNPFDSAAVSLHVYTPGIKKKKI